MKTKTGSETREIESVAVPRSRSASTASAASARKTVGRCRHEKLDQHSPTGTSPHSVKCVVPLPIESHFDEIFQSPKTIDSRPAGLKTGDERHVRVPVPRQRRCIKRRISLGWSYEFHFIYLFIITVLFIFTDFRKVKSHRPRSLEPGARPNGPGAGTHRRHRARPAHCRNRAIRARTFR